MNEVSTPPPVATPSSLNTPVTASNPVAPRAYIPAREPEFYFENTGTIHIRSASRIGHSDMGVNRERLEDIRLLFDEIISGSIAKIPLNQ